MRRAAIVFCLAALVAGCAHYPVNARLDSRHHALAVAPQYPQTSKNSDGLFVVLAFSGGGTRAAALAYGVMKALARQPVFWNGTRRSLLDEVDVITAVSGGSVTAAYYGLFRRRLFTDFEPRFLRRNVQGILSRKLMDPFTWFRLASDGYDRVDLTADYLDRHLFDHGTFGDMARNGRPLILINATDMTSGSEFEFDEPQFRLICSDLNRFPVARAVAASSAFPIILTPVRLRNYAGSCGYRPPLWITTALAHPDISSRRYHEALAARSYLDAGRRPYIHLLDGGISDNLGLRGLLGDLQGPRDTDSVLYRAGFARARRVVFIVVNAQTGPDIRWDQTESSPTLRQMFRAVSTAQVSRYNLETIELLRQSLFKWAARARRQRTGKMRDVAYYVIDVGFDALTDERERAFFNNLPTRYRLPARTVERVEAVAEQLLEASAQYQALLRDLKAPPGEPPGRS